MMTTTTTDNLNDTFDYITVEAESNPGSLQRWLSVVKNGTTATAKNRRTRRSDMATEAKKHLSSLGWRFSYFPRKNEKRELRYRSPKGKWFHSLATACTSCLHESESPGNHSVAFVETVSDDDNVSKKRKRVDDGETAAFHGTNDLDVDDVLKKKRKLVNVCETTAFNGVALNKEKKRKRVNGCETAAFNGTKALLSVDVLNKKRKLVDDCETTAFDGVALNKEKKNVNEVIRDVDVSKKRKRAFDREAEGERRPKFKKSLRRVLEAMEKKNETCEKESVKFWRKDCGPEKNCDVCCACYYGGDLILCDGCPSAFHHTCLGLPNLPEEELWFCPRCCCDDCGSMTTVENSKLMTCEQCQRRFHLKCVKQEAWLVCRKGWFCSEQCSRVFSSLQSLIGRKIKVGEEGLVWSLHRAPDEDETYDDEQMAKLDSAVEILHEGFEPSTDPFSGRDLVEELVFRNGVGRGFYTVMIERNNEPVTVATVRVDQDAAEVPLVATSSSYRRSGMCRVLMGELEKQMFRMGVRRLVLPAAKDVVTTWSEGFGFEVMESRERLKFVKHGMLDFVGTVMCHKLIS